MVDDQMSLKYNTRLVGGGPVSGYIAYVTTKAICYGTAVAGFGAATVATGGISGAATGAATAVITAQASAGASVAAGAIAGAGLSTEAALLTLGVVTECGSVASMVAFVEGLSGGVGAFFTSIPFLP